MTRAVTHLEVYRPLAERPSVPGTRAARVLPLVGAGIRASVRRKLPLALVYAPPAIGTVVFGFGIQAGALAEKIDGGMPLAQLLSAQAEQLLAARRLLVQYNTVLSAFALFAIAWYGSGLLCGDRRAGTHQLYFSRPITRLDYLAGKFLTAAFFGALAMLVPGLVLCLLAIQAAPGWSFLTEQGDVVLRTIAYGVVWTVFTASVTLCASSLFPRRSYAFAGLIGATMVLEPIGHLFGEIFHEGWVAVAPLQNLLGISLSVFGSEGQGDVGAPASWAWPVLVGIVVLALAVTVWRTRRLEVVA